AVGQSDRQHVALAVRGHDGLVLLAGGAAAVLDHRERRKVARERLDRRVEVLDLEALEPGRKNHRDARGVVGMVLCGHDDSVFVVCGHCTGPICSCSALGEWTMWTWLRE